MSEETKRLDLRAAVDALRKVFGAISPDDRATLLNTAAKEFWPKASWSNVHPHVVDTAMAQGGVGILPYYVDEDGKVHIILMRASGTQLYQMIGGHINFAPKGDESIAFAVARENREELVNINCEPILPSQMVQERIKNESPLDLKLIRIRGTARLVMSYKLPLTDYDVQVINYYAGMSKSDPEYKKLLHEYSEHEVDGIGDFILDDVIANPEMLRHPDQLSALVKLKNILAPQSIVAPVVGNNPATP